MWEGCECRCTNHQACCSRSGVALRNPALKGNIITGDDAATPRDCCRRCTAHPGCGSWEFTTRGRHGNPFLPRLVLNGPARIEFNQSLYLQYFDDGANCTEAGESLNQRVSVSGNAVRLSVAGTYHITYHCDNMEGATAAPVNRTVIVHPRRGALLTVKGAISQVYTIGDAAQPYADEGATCVSARGTPLPVKVSGANVPLDRPGTYEVLYGCIDSQTGDHGSAKRKITVVPAGFGIPDHLRPRLLVRGAEMESLVESLTHETYADAGAVCKEYHTGKSLAVVAAGVADVRLDRAGTYTITYACTDTQGVPAKPHTRTIRVLARGRPIIALGGGYLQTYTATANRSAHVDGSVTCISEDGQTLNVETTGDHVRRDVPGEYKLQYHCADPKTGHAALAATRRVVILPRKTVATHVGKSMCVLKQGEPIYVNLPAAELDNATAVAGPRAPSSQAESRRQAVESCPAGWSAHVAHVWKLGLGWVAPTSETVMHAAGHEPHDEI
jgi:hypothetical protein